MSQPGPQSPRPIDPLLAAVAESVATGYQMLDHVVEGLRESLQLQAGSPARIPPASAGPTAAVRPGGGISPGAAGQRGSSRRPVVPSPRHRSVPGASAADTLPAGLVQDVAALVAEALGLAGTLVQDVAQAIGEQTHGSGGEECLPTLGLSVPAGATGTLTFTVSNNGSTLLRDVELSATDLIGGSGHGADTTLTFDPPAIAQIGPRKGEPVKLSVVVAADAPPGLRRGVVAANPGDASALLELTVTAPAPVAAQPAESGASDREPS